MGVCGVGVAVMLAQDTVNPSSPLSPAPTSRVMQLLISPTTLKQEQQQDSGELRGPGARWRAARGPRPPLQPLLAKNLVQEVSIWDWGETAVWSLGQSDWGWSDLGAHTNQSFKGCLLALGNE